MGECADDILKTLNLDKEKATYDEVKTAINDYFEVRRNVIVERVKFNKRVQQQVNQLTHLFEIFIGSPMTVSMEH